MHTGRDGAVAVVTGAAAGIGQGIALRLAEEGAAVSVLDIGSADETVSSIPHQPFADLTFSEWRRVLTVNPDSLFLVCQAFVPYMMDAGSGRIVNISSAAVGSTYSPTNLVELVSRTGRRRPSTIRQDDIDPAE